MSTEDTILLHATSLFALSGERQFGIRALAQKVGVAQSVIYHYFSSKDKLLRAVFDRSNTNLGIERAKLPQCLTPYEMLAQRVMFQLDHAEEIVAVLKYYLHFRTNFPKTDRGFIPEKGYTHIEEMLLFGVAQKEFANREIEVQAKVITHAINGFILEYYPAKLNAAEKKELVGAIAPFIYRGIIKKEDE